MQGEVNDENANAMGGVAGHAGMFASATDIARFAECMLRGGAPTLAAGDGEALYAGARHRRPGTTRALGWDTPSRPESSSGRIVLDMCRSGIWDLPGHLCGSIPAASCR